MMMTTISSSIARRHPLAGVLPLLLLLHHPSPPPLRSRPLPPLPAVQLQGQASNRHLERAGVRVQLRA